MNTWLTKAWTSFYLVRKENSLHLEKEEHIFHRWSFWFVFPLLFNSYWCSCFHLKDSTRSMLLDWKRRLNIIDGIVQGLLYLHKYSRLKVVHRDLKASNILLDEHMNPKISDFGMARIFSPQVSQVNTKRIVGT